MAVLEKKGEEDRKGAEKLRRIGGHFESKVKEKPLTSAT